MLNALCADEIQQRNLLKKVLRLIAQNFFMIYEGMEIRSVVLNKSFFKSSSSF